MRILERICTWRRDTAVFREYGGTRTADVLERLAAELEHDLEEEAVTEFGRLPGEANRAAPARSRPLAAEVVVRGSGYGVPVGMAVNTVLVSIIDSDSPGDAASPFAILLTAIRRW